MIAHGETAQHAVLQTTDAIISLGNLGRLILMANEYKS